MRRFLKFYLLCGVAAGVCVLVANIIFGEWTVFTLGASGAIFGVLVAFGILFPDTIILMFFLFPMKAKYAVMVFGAIEFIGFWTPGTGVSHVAHLGGMLFGYLYLKTRLQGRPGNPATSLRTRFQDWKRQRARRKFQVYMKKQQSGRDPWVN